MVGVRLFNLSASALRPQRRGTGPGRKLVAVVHADMVGYSRLIGLDDAGTIARIRSLRASLLDPLIARHGGNVIQTAGDSLLVLFDSILEAVRCAVVLQQRLPGHPVNDGHGVPIRFRIGIEMGDVIADSGDYHGEGIIVAVRLEAACPPGAICVSRAVHEYVQGRIPAKVIPLGALELKNVTRKVEAVVLKVDPLHELVDLHTFRAPDTALFHGLSPGDEAPRAPSSIGRCHSSIASLVQLSVLVLPLRSLDSSDAHERLAASVTEDIVTDLSRYLKSLVLGEVQVLFHDDRLTHEWTWPRDYKADYVLRGSVQGRRRASVNLQLMNAASGVCIWAERSELYGPRDQIAPLVHGMSNALVRDVGRRIEALATSDLTLHDLLMRGRAWLLGPTSVSTTRQALVCFERAIAMEPDSVGARLGIATVLVRNLTHGWSQAIEQDEARAEALLLDIFQADTDLALTHGVNGTLRRLQGRLNESGVELEMAMDLAPHYAMASSQLGMTLVFSGQPDAALPLLERSVRVAPHDTQTPLLLNNLGMCRLVLGDVDTAIDRLREASAGNPQHPGPPLLLAAALGLKSARIEANAVLRRAVGLCPAFGTYPA